MSKKSEQTGIDIMISLDTTGSMFPCAAEARRKIRGMVKRLFDQIDDLRLGIIFHGDYEDDGETYVLKMLDLTNDRKKVIDFVNRVGQTCGYDSDECYEYVLNRARTATWLAGRARVLVLMGDARPHEPSYYRRLDPGLLKRLKIGQPLDWRNEGAMLEESRIAVYPVQCLNFHSSTPFYKELARITKGRHLRLNQFRDVERCLLAIAYKQDSDEALQAYEDEMREEGVVSYGVEDILDTLHGRETKRTRRPSRVAEVARVTRTVDPDDLEPVDPARFQVFDVTEEDYVDGKPPQIRDFVESMGIKFEKGRGFYPHVTRTETIQENKEVILEDLETGDMFTGDVAREMIGLPFGERGRIKPNPVPGFRCWVQSTSYNRGLRERGFLYEVPEKAGAAVLA